MYTQSHQPSATQLTAQKLALIIVLSEQKQIAHPPAIFTNHLPYETQSALTAFLRKQSSKLSELYIEWQCDNPALAKDSIFKVSYEIHHLLNFAPNLNFSAAIRSSGHQLKPALLASFIAFGISDFHLSLTVPQLTAPLSNQALSPYQKFKHHWSALMQLTNTSHPFAMIVHIPITNQFLDTQAEFLSTFTATLAHDPRFKIQLHFQASPQVIGAVPFQRKQSLRYLYSVIPQHMQFREEADTIQQFPDCWQIYANGQIERKQPHLASRMHTLLTREGTIVEQEQHSAKF